MSAPPTPQKRPQTETGPRGNFDVEIDRKRVGPAEAELTGRLTRAADGRAYAVSLRVSHQGRPHPETDETMATRVLSGRLSPSASDALEAADALEEEGTPHRLGNNRIMLFENLAEAAAIMTSDGHPNQRREATFYGLANIDGVVERVAAWEVGNVDRLPARLLGHTRPFTPKPNLDVEDQMEQARTALRAADPARPQAPVPAIQSRVPWTGQGTA